MGAVLVFSTMKLLKRLKSSITKLHWWLHDRNKKEIQEIDGFCLSASNIVDDFPPRGSQGYRIYVEMRKQICFCIGQPDKPETLVFYTKFPTWEKYNHTDGTIIKNQLYQCHGEIYVYTAGWLKPLMPVIRKMQTEIVTEQEYANLKKQNNKFYIVIKQPDSAQVKVRVLALYNGRTKVLSL